MNIEDMGTFEVNGKKCIALVRKLTEREAFRLRGVDEAHIDTIANCGVSRSAQYKMAGNSIVAGTGYKDNNGNYDGVLFNIFRKLFVDTACEIDWHGVE